MKNYFVVCCIYLFSFTSLYSSSDTTKVSLKDLTSSSPLPFSTKSSFLSVTLSSLVPGLGHVYLGDLTTAGDLFGTSSLAFGIGMLNSSSESLQLSTLATIQNTWFYSIYAAYRDTRIYNKELGYAYKMPMDNFTELSFAPFKFSILKKPEVWCGLLGALSLGSVISYFAYHNSDQVLCSLSSDSWQPIIAFPIGIGEEAFFRGYLQSALSEICSPWGAITLSSLAFGAMHIPNAQLLNPEYQRKYYTYSLPLITSLGAYFGWLTYKNHSLQESVALHSWYDFILFLAISSTTQAAITGKSVFTISIPF